MDHTTAERVLEAIERSRFVKPRDDLVAAAVRYARLRTDWQLSTREQRMAMDRTRSGAHNVLIDACNILSRAMGEAGEDNAWRGVLGTDRKEVGDFACHLQAILGVRAR